MQRLTTLWTACSDAALPRRPLRSRPPSLVAVAVAKGNQPGGRAGSPALGRAGTPGRSGPWSGTPGALPAPTAGTSRATRPARAVQGRSGPWSGTPGALPAPTAWMSRATRPARAVQGCSGPWSGTPGALPVPTAWMSRATRPARAVQGCSGPWSGTRGRGRSRYLQGELRREVGRRCGSRPNLTDPTRAARLQGPKGPPPERPSAPGPWPCAIPSADLYLGTQTLHPPVSRSVWPTTSAKAQADARTRSEREPGARRRAWDNPTSEGGRRWRCVEGQRAWLVGACDQSARRRWFTSLERLLDDRRLAYGPMHASKYLFTKP